MIRLQHARWSQPEQKRRSPTSNPHQPIGLPFSEFWATSSPSIKQPFREPNNLAPEEITPFSWPSVRLRKGFFFDRVENPPKWSAMVREPSNFSPKTHPAKIAKGDRSWGRVEIIRFVSFPVDRLQWLWAQMQAYSASLQSGHFEKLRVNFSTRVLASGVVLTWTTTGKLLPAGTL